MVYIRNEKGKKKEIIKFLKSLGCKYSIRRSKTSKKYFCVNNDYENIITTVDDRDLYTTSFIFSLEELKNRLILTTGTEIKYNGKEYIILALDYDSMGIYYVLLDKENVTTLRINALTETVRKVEDIQMEKYRDVNGTTHYKYIKIGCDNKPDLIAAGKILLKLGGKGFIDTTNTDCGFLSINNETGNIEISEDSSEEDYCIPFKEFLKRGFIFDFCLVKMKGKDYKVVAQEMRWNEKDQKQEIFYSLENTKTKSIRNLSFGIDSVSFAQRNLVFEEIYAPTLK